MSRSLLTKKERNKLHQRSYYLRLSPERKAIKIARQIAWRRNLSDDAKAIMKQRQAVYQAKYLNECDPELKAKRRRRLRFQTAISSSKTRCKDENYTPCTATVDEIEAAFTGYCHNPECGMEETDDQRLFMDHDHRTGKFRGWLCRRCNTALGLVFDDPCRLAGLSSYLLDT
jgi:hypothetical protein